MLTASYTRVWRRSKARREAGDENSVLWDYARGLMLGLSANYAYSPRSTATASARLAMPGVRTMQCTLERYLFMRTQHHSTRT